MYIFLEKIAYEVESYPYPTTIPFAGCISGFPYVLEGM